MDTLGTSSLEQAVNDDIAPYGREDADDKRSDDEGHEERTEILDYGTKGNIAPVNVREYSVDSQTLCAHPCAERVYGYYGPWVCNIHADSGHQLIKSEDIGDGEPQKSMDAEQG